jgi:hypothetical protein
MKKAPLLLSFALGCIVALLVQNVLRPSPALAQVDTRWRYKFLNVVPSTADVPIFGSADYTKADNMRTAGSNGWEAVAISPSGLVLFKHRY